MQETALDIQVGDWVVCLNGSLNPSTWGQVTGLGSGCADVHYGPRAPIWGNTAWEIEYLRKASSEAEAKKIVRDYEATIDYDPR